MNEQNTAKEIYSPSAQDEYKDARVSQTLILSEYFQACQPPAQPVSDQEECKSGVCSLNWKPARPAA